MMYVCTSVIGGLSERNDRNRARMESYLDAVDSSFLGSTTVKYYQDVPLKHVVAERGRALGMAADHIKFCAYPSGRTIGGMCVC